MPSSTCSSFFQPDSYTTRSLSALLSLIHCQTSVHLLQIFLVHLTVPLVVLFLTPCTLSIILSESVKYHCLQVCTMANRLRCSRPAKCGLRRRRLHCRHGGLTLPTIVGIAVSCDGVWKFPSRDSGSNNVESALNVIVLSGGDCCTGLVLRVSACVGVEKGKLRDAVTRRRVQPFRIAYSHSVSP